MSTDWRQKWQQKGHFWVNQSGKVINELICKACLAMIEIAHNFSKAQFIILLDQNAYKELADPVSSQIIHDQTPLSMK